MAISVVEKERKESKMGLWAGADVDADARVVLISETERGILEWDWTGCFVLFCCWKLSGEALILMVDIWSIIARPAIVEDAAHWRKQNDRIHRIIQPHTAFPSRDAV